MMMMMIAFTAVENYSAVIFEALRRWKYLLLVTRQSYMAYTSRCGPLAILASAHLSVVKAGIHTVLWKHPVGRISILTLLTGRYGWW